MGVSITESGVLYIALVVPQIVTLVIIGAIVSKWGQYVSIPYTPPTQLTQAIQVPYMIAGVVITSIGAGLLTTIRVSTPKPAWVAFMVITGIGTGMAQQLPYTAVQAVLE